MRGSKLSEPVYARRSIKTSELCGASITTASAWMLLRRLRRVSLRSAVYGQLTRVNKIFTLGICLLSLLSCACVGRGPAPSAASALGGPPLRAEGGGFWWTCRFKIGWPAEKDPDFAVDLLLAHAVVRPVLLEHQSGILYWRFHRRAVLDNAGHQFSLLFYSDPSTAREVFREIEASEILREMLAAGIVEKTVADDPAAPSRPGVEDTSDRNWSPVLQRHWPAFIMGVSSLWLGLIDEAAAEEPDDAIRNVPTLLERYRKANARVTSIWYKEGQHAFLHHLNALFGYEPLLIKKEMRF